MKYYFFIAALIFLFSSCGTYRINKTSDFGKISNLGELDGTYLNEESKEQGIRMMQFFGSRENIDSVTIRFPDDNTLLVSCLIDNALVTKEFKGEKKKKYFEIYFEKKQLIVPLIYSKIAVSRLRIGRYKNTKDLLIRNLDERNGNILIIAGGYGGEKPYVYKNVEE